MSISPRSTLKILGFLILTSLSCSVFTPEYQEKLRREATETTQAGQITPDPGSTEPAATIEPTVEETLAIIVQD